MEALDERVVTRDVPRTQLGTPGVATSIAIALAALALAVGLFARLWLIFHAPTTSDAAIVGMMARDQLDGHFTAFYWGQAYGGSAEATLIAVAFALFGHSGVVAEMTVAVLTAVAAVLTWRIARRIVAAPSVALLAGALAWAAPAAAVRDSVRVYGFRGVTLVCGLAAILFALRAYEPRPQHVNLACLGLALGVGWWSSPEIAYFVVPVIVLLGAAIISSPRPRRPWASAVAIGVATSVLGALPWLWANAHSGLASLSTGPPVPRPAYPDRLETFFRFVLPMMLGLRRADDGVALVGGAVAACVVVGFGVALVLCLIGGSRSRALALGVIAFPPIYAVFPNSWAWQDGRYAMLLPPLLAIVVAVGSAEAARRTSDMLRRRRGEPLPSGTEPALGSAGSRSAASLIMCVAVAISLVLAVNGVRGAVKIQRASYMQGWGDPDAPTLRAIERLEAEGITAGYANYWVAYKLDFLSNGRLNITTAGHELDRSPKITAAVEGSATIAYLFVPPSQGYLEGIQFTAPWLTVGPDTLTQEQFIATLQQLGVGYRIVDAGILQAVVPARVVTPQEAGLPGAS